MDISDARMSMAEPVAALQFALEIGLKEIQEIGKRLKVEFGSLVSIQEQKQFLENEALYLYLKNFWQHYNFLIKKVETESDTEDYQYYIPLTRILLEIYAELLYFTNQSEKNKIGVFMGNYFLYLSDTFHFVATKNIAIKNEYDRLFLLWKHILSAESIAFPADINDFSNAQLRAAASASRNLNKFLRSLISPYYRSIVSVIGQRMSHQIFMINIIVHIPITPMEVLQPKVTEAPRLKYFG